MLKYKDIDYTINYQKRKTIAAYFKNGNVVEIRAPKKLSNSELFSFFDSYYERIKSGLEKQKDFSNKKESFSFNDSTGLYLFGKKYPVRLYDGKVLNFENGFFYLPNTKSAEMTANLILDFYYRVCEGYIIERCEYLAKEHNIKVAKIGITAAKTCWGSCSGKNSINFSQRLAMADKDDIDYVIIHELSHTVFHNHSPKFYAFVGSIKPDYEKNIKSLKLLSSKLQSEFPF